MHIQITFSAGTTSKDATLERVNAELTAAAETNPTAAPVLDAIATAVRPAIDALPDSDGLVLCSVNLFIGVAHAPPIASSADHAAEAESATSPN